MRTLRFLHAVARATTCAIAAAWAVTVLHGQGLQFGEPRVVAPGVSLYRSTDSSLISPAGPISVWLLRVDPAQADLRAALANDEVVGTETVGGTVRLLPSTRASFFRMATRRASTRSTDA